MAKAHTTLCSDPETEDGYQAALGELRERWARWTQASGCPLGDDSFEHLVHYKWGYVDGHLTRWTCADVDEVLLGLYPAKVVMDADGLDEVIPETLAFIEFLADTDLLDPASDDRQVLVDHVGGLGPPFRRRMADRSLYSPGKRLWTAALEEGVKLDDQDAVSAFIGRFNSRARTQRQSLLGKPAAGDHGGWGTGRFTPPATATVTREGTSGSARRGTGRVTPPGTPPRPKRPGSQRRR
ncbi:MAG TPA: hypothetical protein VG184_04790 [Acidimicrobiales bacterium]|jgi:hypothetical protein|nr:hypothetical protein [Acidimicrobiales bacterium]